MVYKFSELAGVAKEVLGLVDIERATIVAMEGELGAGKTALTKAMAKELGITDTITSPTFVLHLEYEIKSQKAKVRGKTLNHIDIWRMETFEELERVGLQRMIDEKSIIVIEWADKFKSEIKSQKAKVIWVKIDYGENEDERIVLISN